MKEIILSRGEVATVDDLDFDRLNQFLWYLKRGYASRSVYSGGSVPVGAEAMHRAIIHCPEGCEIDHIDGNKLNNTRMNLRAVPHQKNMFNMNKRYDNKSGYRGVCWHGQHRKWYAVVSWTTPEGKRTKKGKLFKDVHEAAAWWNGLARQVYGDNFRPNEINQTKETD